MALPSGTGIPDVIGGVATTRRSSDSLPRTALRTVLADAPPASPRNHPVHWKHAKSPMPATGEQSGVFFASAISAADAGEVNATDSAFMPWSDLLM